MAVAQGACQLLLLQVHHAHDVGQLGRSIAVVEQRGLCLHPQLREHDPAHPVELRQRHHAAHQVGEHAPQLALQVFGAHRLEHFVLAQHALRLDGVAQLRTFELLARDVRKHHAITPGEGQLAVVVALRLHQLRVALERVHNLVRVLARLLQRVDDTLGNTVRDDLPGLPVGALDRGEPPVLDLQHQQAAARMDHHEIRVREPGADRNVVPQPVVVVEFLLQPLGQAPLAAGHAGGAGAERGDEGCHRLPVVRRQSCLETPRWRRGHRQHLQRIGASSSRRVARHWHR